MDLKPKTGNEGNLPWAELIVRNGRHAGARRSLTGAVTLIGRAAGTDLRIQAEGVENHHCVLVRTSDGAALRVVQPQAATLVNGERATRTSLKDGDVLTLGVVRFEIRCLVDAEEVERRNQLAQAEEAQREAWRVQVAAVAAQQAALEEQEVRLQEQRRVLAEKESDVNCQLEEKRRKLEALSEEVKAERETLGRERASYEAYIARMTGDLTSVQRELMEGQRFIQQQKQRLTDLRGRIKQRWHRFWMKERKAFRAQQAELVEQMSRFEEQVRELREEEARVDEKRLRFNALYELSRGRLREAWQKLKGEQGRWKHRRGKERAALRVRERDLEQAETQLIHAQELFLLDQKAWEAKKQSLEQELNGLERRVVLQRSHILDGRETLLRIGLSLQPQASAEANPPAPLVLAAKESSDAPEGSLEATWHQRLRELEAVNATLADQRLALVEQWQRLALVYRAWQKEKEQAAEELEALARKLLEQGETLATRERTQLELAASVRQEHEEVLNLRHQMIAWRARLRVRENAWQSDRSKLLAEVKHREAQAEQQHATLLELQERWSKGRAAEVARFESELHDLTEQRHASLRLRGELAQRAASLEDEKRHISEKALALEQLRQEVLAKTDQAAAERKLERYRRRWITQNTVALRQLAREREALKEELATLDTRAAELDERLQSLHKEEADLSQRKEAWEHQQALALTRQTRLQEELKHAEQQRSLSEERYARMKEEVERIARSFFAEPEPPAQLEEMAA